MSGDTILAIVLSAIAVVAVLARVAGSLFVKLRQPPVVGEIILGIALGPTVLGLLFDGGSTALIPPIAAAHLGMIAQLGLIMFMFLIGLEFETSLIRGRGRIATTISISSVALPLGLGALLATWLAGNHPPPNGGTLPFALFLGSAMAVTAFPVLARILKDRNMYQTPVGALAMTVAAVDDVLAWTLLAVTVAIANSSAAGGMLLTAAGAIVYIAFMFLVVKPWLTALGRRYRRSGRLEPGVYVVILAGALLSAGATSAIGLHAIFGAFLFGVLVPRNNAAGFVSDIRHRVEPVVVYLLLPLFFVVTGMHVNVTQLDWFGWAELAAVLGIACSSKFVGAMGAARAFRISWRESATLGILLNTRGLTELVILSVGRELGLIGDELFTIMVLMAVFTTVMADPLLRLVRNHPERRGAAAVPQNPAPESAVP